MTQNVAESNGEQYARLLHRNSSQDGAAIEDLDFQRQLELYEGNIGQVLHISTNNSSFGSLRIGHILPVRDIFNVLFVQNAGGNRFQRMGVRRLYGADMAVGFSREA